MALSRVGGLVILKQLFQQVYIPTAGFEETVLRSRLIPQPEAILATMRENFLQVIEPQTQVAFKRMLGPGEPGVIQLAVAKPADGLRIENQEGAK